MFAEFYLLLSMPWKMDESRANFCLVLEQHSTVFYEIFFVEHLLVLMKFCFISFCNWMRSFTSHKICGYLVKNIPANLPGATTLSITTVARVAKPFHSLSFVLHLWLWNKIFCIGIYLIIYHSYDAATM